MTNLPAVVSVDALVVSQNKETLEAFTNIETANSYAIRLPDGQPALFAAEESTGVGAFLSRNFLKNKRPFKMSIRDGGGNVALNLHRPWTWFFSKLVVSDGASQPVGTIQQRFAFFAKRFSVLDASGNEIAQLHGPIFKPWTFRVLVQEQEVGKITKKWSGFLKEAFSDADNFGVQFGPGMNPLLRSLALAATFLIDFLYFEDRE